MSEIAPHEFLAAIKDAITDKVHIREPPDESSRACLRDVHCCQSRREVAHTFEVLRSMYLSLIMRLTT